MSNNEIPKFIGVKTSYHGYEVEFQHLCDCELRIEAVIKFAANFNSHMSIDNPRKFPYLDNDLSIDVFGGITANDDIKVTICSIEECEGLSYRVRAIDLSCFEWEDCIHCGGTGKVATLPKLFKE